MDEQFEREEREYRRRYEDREESRMIRKFGPYFAPVRPQARSAVVTVTKEQQAPREIIVSIQSG